MDKIQLPIEVIRGELSRALKQRNVVIIAPTGSGKTTQVPQMLLDDVSAAPGRILVVEPRRLACTSVAERIAGYRQTSLCMISDGDGVLK